MPVVDIKKLERKRERDRAYQAKRRAAKKAAKLIPTPGIGRPWTAPKPEVKAELLTNYVSLLVDQSGSMATLRREVVEQLNKQILNIKKTSYEAKQKTLVSVYVFSGKHTLNALVRNAHPEAVQTFTAYDYSPNGQTALLDSMDSVMTDLHQQDDGAKTTSFLMVVLTDGQENDSFTSSSNVKDRLARFQGTDRWTFAMLMPPGGRNYARQLGIPEGNVQEWEGTRLGLERASANVQYSTQSYYTSRSKGMTSTSKFFTDLSGITKRDLSKLTDLTGDFKRWLVKAECNISDFVSQEHNRVYEPGKAFYQLTKPEKVQAYKQIVIEDRSNKELYGGDEARRLIGIPSGNVGTIKLNPGNHANFNLFVQSTSMNRKLVRGTTLLYKI